MADKRLKGQEISIRVVASGAVVSSIDAISSFNDTVDLEKKSDGFLGETVNRFDEILNGYGGDMEFQVARSDWNTLTEQVVAKARRESPDLVFNVVRTDLFANGDSAIYTYTDVSFGPFATSVASRGDFVKVKTDFSCSERPVQINQLP